MTFEQMERALNGITDKLNSITDNLAVQGQLLDRFEKQSERRAEEQDERIRALLTIGENHERRLADTEERTRSMQAAMTSLFEHIERFIRGLGTDGHRN